MSKVESEEVATPEVEKSKTWERVLDGVCRHNPSADYFFADTGLL